MKGIVFTALTLILAGVLALGLEWLAAFLPMQSRRSNVAGAPVYQLQNDNPDGIAAWIAAISTMKK